MDKLEREWWINASEEIFSGILRGVKDRKKVVELLALPLAEYKKDDVRMHLHWIEMNLSKKEETAYEMIFVDRLCGISVKEDAEKLLVLSLGAKERSYVASHILYLKTIQKEIAEAQEENAELVYLLDPEEYKWWWAATPAEASRQAKTITDTTRVRNLLKLPLAGNQLLPLYNQYRKLLTRNAITLQEEFCKKFPKNKFSFPLSKASEIITYQNFVRENSFDFEAFRSVISFVTSMDFLICLLKRNSGFDASVKEAAAERLREVKFPELKWVVGDIEPDYCREIVMQAVTDQAALESLLLYDSFAAIKVAALERVESPQIMVQALLKEKDPFVLDLLMACFEKQVGKLNADSVWQLAVRDECLAMAIRILAQLEPEAWTNRINEDYVKRLETFLNRTRPYPFESSDNRLWHLERTQNQAAARALEIIYYAGAYKELIFSYNGAEVIGVNKGRSLKDGETIYSNDPPEIFCVDEEYKVLMVQKYGESRVKEWEEWCE